MAPGKKDSGWQALNSLINRYVPRETQVKYGLVPGQPSAVVSGVNSGWTSLRDLIAYIPVRELANIGYTPDSAAAAIQNERLKSTSSIPANSKSFTEWSQGGADVALDVLSNPGLKNILSRDMNRLTHGGDIQLGGLPKSSPITQPNTPNTWWLPPPKTAPAPTPNTGPGQDSWDRRGPRAPINAGSQIVENNPANILMGIPPAPTFEYKLNDFTDQANQMAESAYAPQYEAIERAISGVGQRYNDASVMTKGIYDSLVENIAQNTQDINQSYDATIASARDSGQRLQDDIGNIYGQSQQQLADLIASIGGEQAAGELLQSGAADQASYQSNAAQSTEDIVNHLLGQQTAMGDYQTMTGQAQDAYGALAQQDLLANKESVLGQWDEHRTALSGDQARQALALAMQMQGQDLNMQQLMYGAQQDEWRNQMSLTQMQQEMAAAAAAAELEQSRYNDKYDLDLARLILDAQRYGDQTAIDRERLNQSSQGQPKPPSSISGNLDQVLIDITGDPNPNSPANVNVKSAVMRALASNFDKMGTYANAYDFATQIKNAVMQDNQSPTGMNIDLDAVFNYALELYGSGMFDSSGKVLGIR